ncbi:MAG: CPBP family intramembrane glutamic endopeptidase [Bacteroidales bacterium]|jgi:membrane protease YdiL (CAAX protease family)|nr:CPBP family intramembrane glutamic endopeptidase [Bacteroidales bacterium]
MKEILSNRTIMATVAVIAVILFFFLYYLLAHKKLLKNLINRLFPSLFVEGALEFFSEKLTGIIFTGLLPFLLFHVLLGVRLQSFNIFPPAGNTIWYLVIALALVTAVTSFISSKSATVRERSPELRTDVWYPRHVLLAGLGWLFYIFGYEYFFRGILWFLCLDAFGFLPALAINLVLYAAVHVPKGRFMAIGSVPMGIILCLLSYYTGSFHAAFLIHAVMAVTTEIASAWNNPAYQFRINN